MFGINLSIKDEEMALLRQFGSNSQEEGSIFTKPCGP